MCCFINSHLKVFYKLGVLKNLAQFVENKTYWKKSIIVNDAGWQWAARNF